MTNHPPKTESPKTAISLFVHLSKMGNKIHAAIDANVMDLRDFGLTMQDMNYLADSIEKSINKPRSNNEEEVRLDIEDNGQVARLY